MPAPTYGATTARTARRGAPQAIGVLSRLLAATAVSDAPAEARTKSRRRMRRFTALSPSKNSFPRSTGRTQNRDPVLKPMITLTWAQSSDACSNPGVPFLTFAVGH